MKSLESPSRQTPDAKPEKLQFLVVIRHMYDVYKLVCIRLHETN